ncbi:hypothetical protein ACVILK_003711 [Bradyrhizobium embrapense]
MNVAASPRCGSKPHRRLAATLIRAGKCDRRNMLDGLFCAAAIGSRRRLLRVTWDQVEASSRSRFLSKGDVRKRAPRLSRGTTASHLAGSCLRAIVVGNNYRALDCAFDIETPSRRSINRHPVRSALERIVLTSFAPRISAERRLAPVRSASVRSHPRNSAPLKSAFTSFDLRRFALVRSTPFRFAELRLDSTKVASERLPPANMAYEKSA